jgi:hypothetical protein
MLRRLACLSTALFVLVSCADGKADHRPSGRPGSSTEPPVIADPAAVAHVVCRADSVAVDTPVVRARMDGVYVTIENAGDVWGFEFRSVSDPHSTWNSGPIDAGTTRVIDAAGPGEVLVACLRTPDDRDAPTAELEIVDPDGLFVPWDPACGFGEQFRMTLAADQDEDAATVFRRVPGVEPSDHLRTPKYPGSPQYGPTVMVFREGVAVARFMAQQIGTEWHLLINACPGSGIEKS